jgi:hypothetical protein
MGKRAKEDGFEKRLMIYSAAAAGALAVAPAADAAVQYSGIMNLPVNSSQHPRIDFNNDGTDDFGFSYYQLSFVRLIGLFGLSSGSGHIAEWSHGDAARLPSNYLVGPGLTNPGYYWTNGWNALNGTVMGYTNTMGNFNNATGYIGVRFNADCGTAYGWIQYQGVTNIGGPMSGTIIDWAYEDTCQPIQAGDTIGSDMPVPTMNQWGLIVFTLLLGALAARELRRSSRKKGDASA